MKKVLIILTIGCIISLGVPFIVRAQSIPVGGPCANDSQCLNGHCLNYTCVCMFDYECPVGQPICCTDSCRSATPVGAGGWCCKDIQCQSGTCDQDAEMCLCDENNDCPNNQTCNLATGMCGDQPGSPGDWCDSNTDCRSNDCDIAENMCLCTGDDCPSGQTCNLTIGMCETSSGTCTSNAQCFPYICNLMLHICGPCGYGYDCNSGQTCNNGYCESGETGAYYCYFVDSMGSYEIDSYSDQTTCMDGCRIGYNSVVDVGPGTTWCCLTQNLGDTNTNVCGSTGPTGPTGPALPGGSSTIPNPLKCGDVECVVQAIADLIAGLVTVAGTIMIIIGGIQYISSAGNEDKAKRAKNTVIYAIIGIAIAVSADFLIGFLREVLGSGGGN